MFAVGFVGSLVLSQGRADPLTVYGNDPLGFVSHWLINLLGMSHLVYGDGLYTLNQTWWYMSLAVVLILALPLVMCIWRKNGWGCFVLFLALSVLMPDVRYLGYFPAAALGVCLAGCDGFAKVCRYTRKPLYIVLHFPVFLLGLFLWLKMREAGIFPLLADTIAAWVSCQFAFDILGVIPVLSNVLTLLGKHSGNIFYLHSFVYSYWILSWRLVFRFRYDLLIFAVTMLLTLFMSVCILAFRRISGYDRLFTRLETAAMVRLPGYQNPGETY